MRHLSWLLLVGLPCAAIEPAGKTLDTTRSVYVESLGATPQAMMLHDMIVTSLANSGLFRITESADRADAVLRGSAEDQVFQEMHHSSDNLNTGFRLSSWNTGKTSKSTGLNLGENESSQSSERKHEASASVRLVNKDGDVIWSTTQESSGGKFRSASADVADKVLRRMNEDLQKARLAASAAASAERQAGIPTR